MTIVMLANFPKSPEEALEVLGEMKRWVNDAEKYLKDNGGALGPFDQPNAVRPETFFGSETYPGFGFED